MKQKVPMICNIVSLILLIVFVIKSIVDYTQYSTSLNSAPFYLWVLVNADQPLRELYGLLHGDTLPDGEALSRAVTAVLEKGAEIIRLAEKERRKYEDG